MNMKTTSMVKTILEQARDKIVKPENWTKGAYARTPSGTDISNCVLVAGEGCRFCAKGAIISVAVPYRSQYNVDLEFYASKLIREQIPVQEMANSIVDYNDLESTKHSDMVELFESAIEDISLALESQT